MHAPALGQLLAEIICDGARATLDVRCLEPGGSSGKCQLIPVAELL